MTAVIYGAVAGSGGLGLHAASIVAGLAPVGPVVALGPGRTAEWPLETPLVGGVEWVNGPPERPSWFARHIVRRFSAGRYIFDHDRRLARWAAAQLDRLRPDRVYAFTQVGLESLEWARGRGIPTVLDNPNGHIRGFAEVCRREWAQWIGGTYRGHATGTMVERVEREYELADRIRVSSMWAKESMVRRGVPAEKVFVCPLPINRKRFAPPAERPPAEGPLRVCYVGSLDVRKGFVYLLRAGRKVGSERVRFEFVGGTGDRGSKALLARERVGLDVLVCPGDPVPAYHRAELFVLPSLEDGFGFVAAEALSCGLPVVVTDQCGAAEWVRPGKTGWVVPAGDVDALAEVLEGARTNRVALAEMGRAARREMEGRDPAESLRQLGERVYQ